MRNTKIVTAVSLSMIGAVSLPTFAQGSATESGNSLDLEIVTVTAQKREQNIQDVPLSVALVTSETIRDAQITRVEDLSQLVPTVTFAQGPNFSNSGLNLRGLGTAVFGIGVEGSVATVIDGVVMARDGAGLNDIPDIERIEVLNGPQGTLFGKNASAGLLHVITRRPSLDRASGSVEVGGTDDSEYRVSASGSLPLSDSVAISANAYYREFDGLWENVFKGKTDGGMLSRGVRAKLLWQPSESFNLLIAADTSKQNHESSGQAPLIAPSTVNIRGLGTTVTNALNANFGIIAQRGNRRTADDGGGDTINDNEGVSAEFNWDVGGFTVTGITARREWSTGVIRDLDWLPLTFIDRNNNDRVDPGEAGISQAGGKPHTQPQLQDRGSRSFSQEFRLASPISDSHDYVLGLFYYDSDIYNILTVDTYNLNDGVHGNVVADAYYSNKNYAVFGQLNYRPTESLTLISGFRYLKDEVSATVSRQNLLLPDNSPLNAATNSTGTDVAPITNGGSNTKFVYKAGLQYRWSEAVMGYVTHSTGFKGAAMDVASQFTVDNFLRKNPVAPEESTSLEVGLRTNLARNLQFNVTAYRTRFDNYQLTTRDLITNEAQLAGVKEVQLQGVELDLVLRPSDALTIRAGMAYSDAVFEDFKNSPCYPGQTAALGCVGAVQNLSGVRMPAAPEWKANLSARYQRPLTSSWNGFVQASGTYQDDVIFSFNNDPRTVQEAYTVANLSLGAESSDGRYSVSAYAKNLFDKFFLNGISPGGNPQGGVLLGQLSRDSSRYFGVNFRINFGE